MAMSNLRDAAQQALEAIERALPYAPHWGGFGALADAADDLQAALAEPEQEPVCWQWLDTANFRKRLPADAIPEHWRPLYTAPTPRKPLTSEQIERKIGYRLPPHSMNALLRLVNGITGETK